MVASNIDALPRITLMRESIRQVRQWNGDFAIRRIRAFRRRSMNLTAARTMPRGSLQSV
jgi:hypothetical protein